ncbi:MAG: cell division protein ZipA C-terminal FtsZ-binding domain-containing protein [Gammaproteobacteria bacterium]
MPELRWILLAAGVALILGLWWWESRKARARNIQPDSWPHERAEPTVTAEPQADPAIAEPAPVSHYAPIIERVRAPRRPPLIEIPDDVEVDVSAYVGKERRLPPEPEFEPTVEVEMPRVAPRRAAADAVPAAKDEEQDDHQRSPWIRTQPLERPDIEPGPDDEEPAEFPTDPVERQTAEASAQRIVALRLVAQGDRWPGAQLRAAFEAEELRYGRYSIFCREREDGKALFYVASLLEPGSFDVARMDQQSFPGISLFGIVPGPLEAPAMFDLILAVSRKLADRLGGQLQDEQGSTLTAQRILNLREELVHYEHRHKRLLRY